MTELSAPKPLMVSREEVIQTARKLLGGSTVWALLAETDEGKPAGVLTLDAAAVYAADTSARSWSCLYVLRFVASV